ncbi:MAG: dienelactone hydrolase family protein [Deltaproteobacteria bacterium]|nr:dienelactone hydrolase family protein [Deltaproteobacteria bacterium]
MANLVERHVEIFLNRTLLDGDLVIPRYARGLVLFAHGSGSSRLSSRNKFVAKRLQERQIATLLFDLLTEYEDRDYMTRFNIELLTRRLVDVTHWIMHEPDTEGLSVAYFGASTGAAAALKAAAIMGEEIEAIVSRGGRPDLAGLDLYNVRSPTLFIVGGQDTDVLRLNEEAFKRLQCIKDLRIVPGAGHLFEEKDTLSQAAEHAAEWFARFMLRDKESNRAFAQTS